MHSGWISVVIVILLGMSLGVLAFRATRLTVVRSICLMSLCLGYLLLCSLTKRAFDPKPPVASEQEFIAKMGPSAEVRLATFNGKSVVEIRPTWSMADEVFALVTLRSGPPCYVFEQGGRLVDWSTDVYADRPFNTRWQGVMWQSSGELKAKFDLATQAIDLTFRQTTNELTR